MIRTIVSRVEKFWEADLACQRWGPNQPFESRCNALAVAAGETISEAGVFHPYIEDFWWSDAREVCLADRESNWCEKRRCRQKPSFLSKYFIFGQDNLVLTRREGMGRGLCTKISKRQVQLQEVSKQIPN